MDDGREKERESVCCSLQRGNRNPFHFQNVLLYGWGTVFTVFSVLIDGKLMVGGMSQLISGHSVLSFCLIANYAFVGIATSGVMKYLDNIAKTFAATGTGPPTTHPTPRS